MTALFDLTGQAAVVVGGTRGIGRAIVRLLASHGCSVAVVSRSGEQSVAVATEATSLGQGQRCIGFAGDLEDELAHDAITGRALRELGRLQHLIICAARDQEPKPLAEVSSDEWFSLLGANITAPALLAGRACRIIAAQRSGGSITLIGSASGFRGSDTYSAYAVAKSALGNLVQQLTAEWGPCGVRANCVAPSLIETEFSQSLWSDPAKRRRIAASYALKRLGRPDDVAGLVLTLVSPAGSWISGQTIVVDGGFSAIAGCHRHLEAADVDQGD